MYSILFGDNAIKIMKNKYYLKNYRAINYINQTLSDREKLIEINNKTKKLQLFDKFLKITPIPSCTGLCYKVCWSTIIKLNQ